MAGLIGRWGKRRVVAIVVAVSLLAVVGGFYQMRSQIGQDGEVVCSCAMPLSVRQMAAESDLVAAGTITDKRSDTSRSGTDYTFRMSRVLMQHNVNTAPEVTVRADGVTGCCGGGHSLFSVNSQQVLFLTRRESGNYETVHGDWGRLALRDNTVAARIGTPPADHIETLDELAGQLSGP